MHQGIDAVRAFYEGNELAQQLELAGNPCVAGNEGAVAMRAIVARGTASAWSSTWWTSRPSTTRAASRACGRSSTWRAHGRSTSDLV